METGCGGKRIQSINSLFKKSGTLQEENEKQALMLKLLLRNITNVLKGVGGKLAAWPPSHECTCSHGMGSVSG